MNEIDAYHDLKVMRVKYLVPLRAYFKSEKEDKILAFNELSKTFEEIVSMLTLEDCDIPFNYDDLMVLRAIEMIIKHNYEPKRAEIEYYQTLKIMYTAYMMDILPCQRIGMKGKITDNKQPICYMDQNVFTRYIKGLDIGYEVPDGFIVPYSPAHIEEISESKRVDLQDEDLVLIQEKTKKLEIVFNIEGGYTIYEEKPEFCYRRVKDGTQDIEMAKRVKMIDDRLYSLRFGDISTEKQRRIFNSQDPDRFILNHEQLVNDVLQKMNVSYDLQYIKEHGNCNDYNVINGFIHNLSSVMDICGFKKDNEERKVRSSRLDIEHLLYGAVARIFLTDDRRLRYRARNIYTAMGKQIECPDFEMHNCNHRKSG